MTREEATDLAYAMGAHPYSVASMVECLLKGVEIGKAEKAKDIEDHLQSKVDKYRGYEPGSIQSMLYKTYEELLLWIKR